MWKFFPNLSRVFRDWAVKLRQVDNEYTPFFEPSQTFWCHYTTSHFEPEKQFFEIHDTKSLDWVQSAITSQGAEGNRAVEIRSLRIEAEY